MVASEGENRLVPKQGSEVVAYYYRTAHFGQRVVFRAVLTVVLLYV